MTTTPKPHKLAVTLDDPELVDTIREITADQHLITSQVVTKLIRRALDALEREVDLAAIAETEGEETYPWEQFKAGMEQARQGGHAA